MGNACKFNHNESTKNAVIDLKRPISPEVPPQKINPNPPIKFQDKPSETNNSPHLNTNNSPHFQTEKLSIQTISQKNIKNTEELVSDTKKKSNESIS